MRRLLIGSVIILFFFSMQVADAGTFYKHDHPSYWWYVIDEPAFSAVVPSGAQGYFQRTVFGMEVLEMTFANGTITMEVIHQPGSDVEEVRAGLEARYRPLVKDVTILSNAPITTSNDLSAHFYAYEALGANGKKVMLRAVFFQKENSIVYLTLFLNSDQYQGDLREYWIKAVNGFEWN